MLNVRRVTLRAVLLLFATAPVAAQMTSMRTVLDSEKGRVETRDADADIQPLMMLDDDGTTDEECGENDGLGLFPTSDAKKAPCFWQQQGFEWLSAAEMVSSGGSVAAATEVMSDFLAGWRVSFTTAVASEADEDTEEGEDPAEAEAEAEQETAANLFRANGGNLSLAAAYPIYAKRFAAINGGFTAVTYGRAAGTFAAFGDLGSTNSQSFDWSELNANLEWALTTRTRVLTTEKKFDVELYTNAGVIAGTKPFRAALGINEKDAGAFLHGEAGVNFRIGGSMVIGASYNYYSANGLERGATLTVGFVPPPKAPAPPAEEEEEEEDDDEG